MGKENFSLKPLIDAPFGLVFRVENGKDGSYLSRIAQTEQGNDVGEKEDGVTGEELRDNREIVCNNTAQVLSSEDIDSRKYWRGRDRDLQVDEIFKRAQRGRRDEGSFSFSFNLIGS